jgi:aminopeptidase N
LEHVTEFLHCHGRTGQLDSRFALKGSQATYAPDRTYDTERIKLEVDIDIARQTLTGRSTTTLRESADGDAALVFDAVKSRNKTLTWNGAAAKYTYNDGKITLNAPRPSKQDDAVTVVIDYVVSKPKMGLYFIKPDRNYPKRPTQVWTQGEDEYARYWFPCHDAPNERTASEVIATVPTDFTAVSNGKLLKTTRNPRRRTSTFHWRHDIPHASYLVTLAIGRFSHLRDSWRGVPVDYYCEKGREAETRRAFGKTPKMLEFFSAFIGVRYPFPKYAQVAAADFIYGGMENTSATTQTDAALLDERVSLDYSSDELVAHELAHQWFGDYLTCKDWSHAWLNESFATYFDPLFKRFDKGEDEFLYALRGNAEAYFQEDKEHYRRSIVTKVFKRPTDLFDRHLYEKGSVVLHMLHRELGEALFRKSIHAYVRKNAGRVVETVNLINAIEDTTGRNMRRFFDQWVFGAGHPEFQIRSWWNAGKREINLRVTQTHAVNAETGLFTVDTAFAFRVGKTWKREKVHIDKKSHLFTFALPSEPSAILFDPDHAILKRADFPKAENAWIEQLRSDANPLGRIDAVHALAKIGSADAIGAVRTALLSDAFWGVQAEAATALGSIARESTATVLLHCLDEIQHPKVRRAIYGALKSFNSQSVARDVEKRFRAEQSYFAFGEALRTLGALRHPKHDEILKEALNTDSWNDVIRIAALEGLANSKSRVWLPLILTLTRPGHSQRLRMTAIRLLGSFGALTTPVQNRLLELINDPFLLVRIMAVRVLHQFGDERAVPALKKLTSGDLDGRLMRLAEEAIQKITKNFE